MQTIDALLRAETGLRMCHQRHQPRRRHTLAHFHRVVEDEAEALVVFHHQGQAPVLAALGSLLLEAGGDVAGAQAGDCVGRHVSMRGRQAAGGGGLLVGVVEGAAVRRRPHVRLLDVTHGEFAALARLVQRHRGGDERAHQVHRVPVAHVPQPQARRQRRPPLRGGSPRAASRDGVRGVGLTLQALRARDKALEAGQRRHLRPRQHGGVVVLQHVALVETILLGGHQHVRLQVVLLRLEPWLQLLVEPGEGHVGVGEHGGAHGAQRSLRLHPEHVGLVP
mmetsp:Transcript_743/g.1566  ORF Transcript_743/g.1566 Transcript_743/m.1566 type:complete len:279 (-) Transcript_743:588-1424(-)